MNLVFLNFFYHEDKLEARCIITAQPLSNKKITKLSLLFQKTGIFIQSGCPLPPQGCNLPVKNSIS